MSRAIPKLERPPLVQNAHMCLQCDGYSHELAMRAFDLQIKIHGRVVVQVGDIDLAFSYTVGLVDNFGHPELTMSTYADMSEMSSIVDIGVMSTYADIMIVRTARDLGAAVRDARLRLGWTQAELADRINVSRQWVISLERGKATAELGTALRAVTALGLIADLVDAPAQDAGIDLDRLFSDDS